MSSETKIKQKLKRLLSKRLGKKIKKVSDENIIFNTEYERYQFLKTLAKICKLEDNEIMKEALVNLRNRGLNKALQNTSEITQLGAFLQEFIEEPGGFAGEDDEYF